MALIDDPNVAAMIRKGYGQGAVDQLKKFRDDKHKQAEKIANRGFNPSRNALDGPSFLDDDDTEPSDAFGDW